MRFDYDSKATSKAAKRLRGYLEREGVRLQHAKAVEAVARVLNFESASAMRAGVDGPASAPDPIPNQRIDADTVETFLGAIDTVIAEAHYALEERESGLDQGLYEEDENPTDQISSDLSRVESALPEIRTFLRAMTAPSRPPFDYEALAVAIRHGEDPANRGRVTFHRDLDGMLHADIIEVDWDNDRAETLQAMLAYLARPDSVLPGLVLDVVEEVPGTYRISTALDYDADRDPETVADEFVLALAELCLSVGIEDGETVLLLDVDENHRRQERNLLTLYRRALGGDPSARRVLGWLMQVSPDYAERLITELRQQLSDSQRRAKPDGNPTDAATRELWDWLEIGRRTLEDGPHRRMFQVQVIAGAAPGARWRLETPGAPDGAPRPLDHLDDLGHLHRLLARTAPVEQPLGFQLGSIGERSDGGLIVNCIYGATR